jgi:hypothetical protein
MNQQQRLAGTFVPIGNTLTVQFEITHLGHVNWSPSNSVLAYRPAIADYNPTYGRVGYWSVDHARPR